MSDTLTGRGQDRRHFLKAGGAVTAALLTPSAFAITPNKALPALPSNPVTTKAMPTRNLGRTGYKVGIFSLGGQAALEKPANFDTAVGGVGECRSLQARVQWRGVARVRRRGLGELGGLRRGHVGDDRGDVHRLALADQRHVELVADA